MPDVNSVSWGNVLDDDVLVWIPHALCRYSHILGLSFDDIGFIAQLYSFRGPKGIMPSDTTLALRGGFKTRNSIIDRYKRLEKMGYVKRTVTRNEQGEFGSCRYDFSALRNKLENLVKKDWELGERTPRKKSHRVDIDQHGDDQHGVHQHGESKQEKPKLVETQVSEKPDLTETTCELIKLNRKTESINTIVTEKKSSDDIVKKNFSSYRKRLQGDNLELFDLIVNNNIDNPSQIRPKTITGKTLLEYIDRSPAAVKSAYNETIERGKDNFSYFSKVFFTHLENVTNPTKGTDKFDYENIDDGLYK